MHRFFKAASRLRARAARSESGFTIIELMVASGIILLSMSALAYAATVGFVDVGYARQRQGATGLANETLELIRAVPVDDVKRGLDTNDLQTTSDPNIVETSPGAYEFRGETIPHGPNTPVAPLVPHQQTKQLRGTSYDISVYITRYTDPATGVEESDVYRATVVVTWNPVRQGTSATVEAQSILYFPVGCESPSTHPFAAPCQPAFYAGGTSGSGRIKIDGVVDGFQIKEATMTIGESTSDLQTEQVFSVQGLGRLAHIQIIYTDGSVEEMPDVANDAVSASSNNPTENKDPWESVSGSQSAETSNLKSDTKGHRLFLDVPGASALSTSTIQANYPTPDHPCPDTTTSEVDNLPCGYTSGAQTSAMQARLRISGKPSDATVFSTSGVRSSVFSNRDKAGQTPSSPCTGNGCASSIVRREIDEVRIGGLPDNGVAPADWNGYLVRLSTYSDSATVAVGNETADPVLSVGSANVLEWWNGAGYDTMTIGTTSFDLAIPTVTAGDTTISNIRFAGGGTSTISEPASCPSGCLRTRAEARVSSPLVGEFTYTVGTAANLNVSIDFGTLLARATHAPAT